MSSDDEKTMKSSDESTSLLRKYPMSEIVLWSVMNCGGSCVRSSPRVTVYAEPFIVLDVTVMSAVMFRSGEMST